MFALRNLLEYVSFQVESCNLTIYSKAGIIDCEAHDSVLVSACLSLWETEGDGGEYSSLQGFVSSDMGLGQDRLGNII